MGDASLIFHPQQKASNQFAEPSNQFAGLLFYLKELGDELGEVGIDCSKLRWAGAELFPEHSRKMCLVRETVLIGHIHQSHWLLSHHRRCCLKHFSLPDIPKNTHP
jgi:hypothetical protein